VIVARALGYVWALPGTIAGLLLGATLRVRPHARDGVLVFTGTRGFAALHRRTGFVAITLGHVVIASEPLEGALWAHELVHVRQWSLLGPLMLVAYPFANVAGYRRNPFERAARRRAGA
jgi:hypothetical protein